MNISGYLDYIKTPWGRLFYRLVWHNLGFKNRKILDFGSGFGVTSNHLAKFNDVTAVEQTVKFLNIEYAIIITSKSLEVLMTLREWMTVVLMLYSVTMFWSIWKSEGNLSLNFIGF